MTDILLRNVDEAFVARIDQRAARLGISRSEYLRRTIERDAARDTAPLSTGDFAKFAGLVDEGLMRDAWS